MKLLHHIQVILYDQIAYNSLCNIFITLHGIFTDEQFETYHLIYNCLICDIYTFKVIWFFS